VLLIDQYAYTNNFRSVHPGEKFAFALLTMIVCLWSSSVVISLIVILLMGGITILIAGVPVRFYLKLIMIPFAFLVIGVITVAVTISREPHLFLFGLSVWGLNFGVTAQGLGTAGHLFCRSLGRYLNFF